MKIDTEYFKLILKKFEDSDKSHIFTKDFQDMLTEDEEKFVFHWKLLEDRKLILDSNNRGLKLHTFGLNGHSIINHYFARLTADGYEFSSALKNNKFMENIQNKLTDFTIDAILIGAKEWLMKTVIS